MLKLDGEQYEEAVTAMARAIAQGALSFRSTHLGRAEAALQAFAEDFDVSVIDPGPQAFYRPVTISTDDLIERVERNDVADGEVWPECERCGSLTHTRADHDALLAERIEWERRHAARNEAVDLHVDAGRQESDTELARRAFGVPYKGYGYDEFGNPDTARGMVGR